MGQVHNGGSARNEDFSAKRIAQINLNPEDWSEEYETGLRLQKLIGSFGSSRSLKAYLRQLEEEGVRVSIGKKMRYEDVIPYDLVLVPHPYTWHSRLTNGNYHANPS